MVGLGAGPGMSGPGAKLRWARKARTRCRILDGGDDAQPAATAGPGEDSEIERTVHQRRPGPGVGGDGGVGLAREGGSVWGGAAIADDLGAPARARGEDAVVEKQVHRGTGDEGRQLLEEFDGLEEEVGGAVAPHTVWEFDEDAPVGAEAEAILSERGAEEIAAELLEAGAIVGGDPDVGVQVEAVEVAWRGPREVRCLRSGSSQRRRTRARALGPRATRPWTEALTSPARTGEVSVSGSAGVRSSAGSSWRRASSRPTRARTVARTCATSLSLGGGAG